MVSRKSGLSASILFTLFQLLIITTAAAWETETVAQSDAGITLRLSGITGDLQTDNDLITCSGPGLLAVAVDSSILIGQKVLFVAVPPATDPVVQVTSVTWVGLGNIEPGPTYQNLLEPHDTGRLRQQNLLPLTLRPFRLLADGTVQIAVRLVIEVDFNRHDESFTASQGSASPESPVFEEQLQSILLNYEQGRRLRSKPVPQLQPLNYQHPDTTVKILVEEDGVYRVSWNWLAARGLDLTGTPSSLLRLFTNETEIPIKMMDGQDGYFDPGDYFIFYGRRQRGEFSDRSRYTPKTAYFLEYSGQAGSHMVDVICAPADQEYLQPDFYTATSHLEQDLIFDKLRNFATYVSAEIDHWYWKEYEQSGLRDEIALEVTFPYHHTPLALTTTIRTSLTSLSFSANMDHHVLCELNGRLFAGDFWWSQLNSIVTEFTVPDSILMEQDNTLVIYVPGDANNSSNMAEQSYLNWVEVEYDRRFIALGNKLHFTNTANDQLKRYRLDGFTSQNLLLFDSNGRWFSGFDVSQQGGNYAITFQDDYPWETEYHAVAFNTLSNPVDLVLTPWEDLRVSPQPVDYILIYHRDFLEAAQKWQELWSSRLNVRLVDVENIYDTFGRGTIAPEPIRDFLACAWENWPAPAFSYVLLMGRGSYMYDKLRSRQPNYYKTCIPIYLDVVQFSTLTSSDEYFACFEGDDDLQDCYIGRLAMTNLADFDHYYNKMIEYDFEYEPDLWHLTHTLVSDEGTNFSSPNHGMVNNLCPPYAQGTIIDLDEESRYYGGNYELRQLIDAGTTTVSYLGHGSTTLMSAHGILSISNYQLLLNQGRYPLGFTWSCLAGGFDHESQKSVSELLVSVADKGFIGSFGSSALALSTADTLFLYQYYNAIFEDHHGTLGRISWDAELAMLFSGFHSYHTKMFNLLGDPALRFSFPRREISLTAETSMLQPGVPLSVDCQLDSVLAGEMSLFLYRDDGIPVNYDQANGVLRPVAGAHLSTATTSSSDGTATLQLPVPGGLTAGYYRLLAYFDGGNIDGVGAIRLSSQRPVVISSTTIPFEPLVGEPVTFVAEVDTLLPPDSMELFFEGIYHGNNPPPTYPLTGENGQWRVTIPYSAFGNQLPVIQRYRYRLYLDGQQWESPGFIFYSVMPAELTWVENSFTIGGQDSVALGLRLRNSGQAEVTEYTVLAREGVHDTLAVYTGGSLNSGESVQLSLHFAQEQGPHSVILEAFIPEQSGLIMRQLDYLLVGPPGLTDYPLFQFPDWRLTAPPATLSHYIGLQPHLEISNLVEPHTGQPGLITPLAAGSHQSDLVLELLSDSSLTLPDLELALRLERPLQLIQADTTLDLADEHLWISFWDSHYNCWVPGFDPVRVDGPDTLQIMQLLTGLPTIARLYAVNDNTPPVIRHSVSNQFFAPGDYVARSPDFGFTIEDRNGIDYGNRFSPPRLILDGSEVDTSRYLTTGHAVWGHLNLSLLELAPHQQHTLSLVATDLAGNMSSDTLTFTVASEFELLHFATHPNPFEDQTRLAWELTDVPNRIQVLIFTASGRQIRTMDKLFPRIGYDEMIWDGLDDLGRQVANGVYYLKFIVECNGEETTKIVKLARLR